LQPSLNISNLNILNWKKILKIKLEDDFSDFGC
jgi:hypothetical protein